MMAAASTSYAQGPDTDGPVVAPATVSPFGSGVAQPSVAPDGSRVVFQKKTGTGWHIFTSRLDGSEAKAITAGPGDDLEPNWRPDGAAIAFSSNRSGRWQIYTMKPDGSGVKAITSGTMDARYPQWSPRAFELPYEKDPLKKTVADRAKANVAPSDLKMLDMLAENSTEWNIYRDHFATRQAARYYKLLYVQGEGDARRIATVREDGLQNTVIDTGLKGAQINPCWDRKAATIAFLLRSGSTNTVYTADYPVTRDLNDGEGKIKFGIDLKALRSSLAKLDSSDGPAAQLSWTPNGEYVASASGYVLQLLPRKDMKLKAVSVPVDAVSPWGFTWLPDASTALVTVTGKDGPELKSVKVDAPLLDVVNVDDFDDLVPGDRSYMQKNSFVAGGVTEKQMFNVYENTDYTDLPIFVTTDSLLHLHHLVFDYLLRGVETDHLTPSTIALVDHYLTASLQQSRTATDKRVKESALSNAAFFAVAARLVMGDVHTGETAPPKANPDDPLAADQVAFRQRQDRLGKAQLAKWTAPLAATLKTLPPSVKTVLNREIALIAKHAGKAESPVFGGKLVKGETISDSRLDYTDFIPRGHYTRSEVLRRYFLMSRWLTAGAFRRTPEMTRRALLIVSATNAPTLATWQKVEDTVHAFVGAADDQDLTAYLAIAKDVYGGRPSVDAIASDAKSREFLAQVAKLPAPKIAPAAGSSFRLLPAPYTPDAEIMQGLVYDGNAPDVGTEERPRYFSLGLDVMAVLGSDRAHEILQGTKFQGSFFDFDLKETEYENYDTQYDALKAQFAEYPDWTRSLYTRTLYTLLPLITGEDAANAPKQDLFAQNPAWTDKSLNTALGVWAELKHDTMPKQPMAIEAGGEGGIAESVVPEQPVGFVEPAPELYKRLGALVAAERTTLTDARFLTPEITQRLTTLSALVTMVQNLAAKQAAGTELTPREVEQLRFFGAYQEHLAMVTSEGGERGSSEGNDMAIVADVSSAYSTKLQQQLALEEGIGHALPIYVAVPFHGHRQLTRGAVFTYYEFTHPAADRLTDERWREVLDKPTRPKLPEWTKSFVSRVLSSYDEEKP